MIIFTLAFFVTLVLFAISGRFSVSFKLGVGLTVLTGAAVRAHTKRYASVGVVALDLRTVSSDFNGHDARGKLCFREHDMPCRD
jgi:hypothetical protein